MQRLQDTPPFRAGRFIALRREEKIYIQVCYLLSGAAVAEQEFGPLMSIRDNYPKLVLSMNSIWEYNREGIQRKPLSDFLLDPLW